MVISFLDGSAVLNPGLESVVKRKIRTLIRNEQQVTCYFYATSDFILICEWVVRELQAANPQKVIESVGVAGNNGDTENTFYVPEVRYTRIEILSGNNGKAPGNILKWMVDQADYVISYMDPLMCCSGFRAQSFRYACTQKKECCINLCSKEEMRQVREKIASLSSWEREAMTAKMNGTGKSAVANRLGVCKSTIRTYEVSAAHELAKKICPSVAPVRRCALLGLAVKYMPDWKKKLLVETLRYLVKYCGVAGFIVSADAPSELLTLLLLLKREYGYTFKLGLMQEMTNKDIAAPKTYEEIFYYEGTAKGIVARGLERRNAMTHAANVVLCDIDAERYYRSGLSYASIKHIPVINLSTYLFFDEDAAIK